MNSGIRLFGCVCVAFGVTTSAAAKPIMFQNACEGGQRITIAAVGDRIFHKKLLRLAFRRRAGFKQFWRPVSGALQNADIAYANLEGPAAHGVAAGGRKVRDPGWRLDYRVYGYRLPNLSFNYHPSVLSDLKESGFDIVSTANNHTMDRGQLGVDRTIDNLEQAGLAFTGTRRQGETQRPWSTLTRAKGLTVAWLACTYSTNGIPDPQNQTLNCFRQWDTVLGELRRLHARTDVDAVMLTPHWGIENGHRPTRRQRRFARAAIDAGAMAVLGAHPHVLQPWEKHVAPDGREGLIAYSLGNFVSNQRRMPQRVGMIALLEVLRVKGSKARITSAGYVPTWVVIDGKGIRVTESKPKSFAERHAARFVPAGNRVRAAQVSRLPKRCSIFDVDLASARLSGSASVD